MDSASGGGARDELDKQAMSQRIKDLESQLAALRATATDFERPSTSSVTETVRQSPVIYVQQDRKLPLFSGRLDNADSLTLDEWIELMREYVQTRGNTEKERAQIVFEHLEGAARTEIKFLSADQKDSVKGIFDVLKDVYGSLHSRISLQRRFFNRKQLEGESLIDYSHALMELMDQISKIDVQTALKSAKDLRDQFCDGVRDQALRIRLRDLINVNPQWTIRDARGEATKWMAQHENQSSKYKCNNSSVLNEMSASCESTVSQSSEYGELVSLLKAQQTQLELVIKALTPQTLPSSRAHHFRPRRSADGKPICFRCEQSGHIARNCTVTVNTEPKKARLPKQGGN